MLIESASLPNSTDPWTTEIFHRSEGLRRGLDAGDPHRRVRDGDVVLISDVDELIRPEVLHSLKHCDGWQETGTGRATVLELRSQLYYYAFSWRHATPMVWTATSGTVWSWAAPNYAIRGAPGPTVTVWDAGWHCSWCFKSLALFRNKVASYSHTEHNQPQYQTRGHILHHVRSGIDLFDRADQQYVYIDPTTAAPPYVRAHADRFGYLLDRRGPTGGFLDFYE